MLQKGFYLLLYNISNFPVQFNRFSFWVWDLPFGNLFCQDGRAGLLTPHGYEIIDLNTIAGKLKRSDWVLEFQIHRARQSGRGRRQVGGFVNHIRGVWLLEVPN